MAYVALYRQWRPKDFDGLVGQEHVSTTLKNAIAARKIAHAYLFAGPRGTGKTSTAKILAKALNCVHGPTAQPCNACENCERINAGTSMDVFEIDAASNRGIDEIRELRETVKFAPVNGKYKVYIIDEVHMLTPEAFNALLKTLEEPPGHVVFILATTEPHKIPATIHSRCQRYDFRRISVREIEERLATIAASSGIKITPEALHLIAMHADGGLRDALSILDQCAALGSEVIAAADVRRLLGLVGHEWVYKLTAAIARRDATEVLLTLDELISAGKDLRQTLLELALHCRSLMLYKAAPTINTIEMYSEERGVLAEQSEWFKHEELVNIIRELHAAANELKWAAQPRITAEMALLAICRRDEQGDYAALAARVSALEAKLASLTGFDKQASEPLMRTKSPSPTPQSTSVPTGDVPVDPKPLPRNEQELQAIWNEVLSHLLASGKRAVHACVSQGMLGSINERQATIYFAAAFPKERTEKEDFRSILEKVLTQVCGRQIKVNCVLGAITPPKKQTAPPPAKQDNHDQYSDALQQAQRMFGGKIISEIPTEEE